MLYIMDNPNIELLSKELFNYLLKYDDCINKYENKQQMDNNEILNKKINILKSFLKLIY